MSLLTQVDAVQDDVSIEFGEMGVLITEASLRQGSGDIWLDADVYIDSKGNSTVDFGQYVIRSDEKVYFRFRVLCPYGVMDQFDRVVIKHEMCDYDIESGVLGEKRPDMIALCSDMYALRPDGSEFPAQHDRAYGDYGDIVYLNYCLMSGQYFDLYFSLDFTECQESSDYLALDLKFNVDAMQTHQAGDCALSSWGVHAIFNEADGSIFYDCDILKPPAVSSRYFTTCTSVTCRFPVDLPYAEIPCTFNTRKVVQMMVGVD